MNKLIPEHYRVPSRKQLLMLHRVLHELNKKERRLLEKVARDLNINAKDLSEAIKALGSEVQLWA